MTALMRNLSLDLFDLDMRILEVHVEDLRAFLADEEIAAAIANGEAVLQEVEAV